MEFEMKRELWQCLEEHIKQRSDKLAADSGYVTALANLVWQQLDILTIDLKSFAKHAGRDSISNEDLLLVLRHNPSLQKLLFP